MFGDEETEIKPTESPEDKSYQEFKNQVINKQKARQASVDLDKSIRRLNQKLTRIQRADKDQEAA